MGTYYQTLGITGVPEIRFFWLACHYILLCSFQLPSHFCKARDELDGAGLGFSRLPFIEQNSESKLSHRQYNFDSLTEAERTRGWWKGAPKA